MLVTVPVPGTGPGAARKEELITVNEMIERLEVVAGDGFGECELRLAFQPKWALQFTIGGIAVPDDESRGMGLLDEDPDDAASVVYIVEGEDPYDDSPYAPPWVFAAAK